MSTDLPDLPDDEVELLRALAMFAERREKTVARLAGGLFKFIDPPHPGAASVSFYVDGHERNCRRQRFKGRDGLTVWLELEAPSLAVKILTGDDEARDWKAEAVAALDKAESRHRGVARMFPQVAEESRDDARAAHAAANFIRRGMGL